MRVVQAAGDVAVGVDGYAVLDPGTAVVVAIGWVHPQAGSGNLTIIVTQTERRRK